VHLENGEPVYFTSLLFVHFAFEYVPEINYSVRSKIVIGAMDKVCQICQTLRFRNQTPDFPLLPTSQEYL
jgi:hypothetical protein